MSSSTFTKFQSSQKLICLSRNLSRGVKKSKSERKGIKRENHAQRSGPSRFRLFSSCQRVPARFSLITPEQNLALQLRMRVMETLAVKRIDDRCHHERQQKLCSSFRKSRKKPFCCHVIEINDGTFKNNLDYLGDVYSWGSTHGLEFNRQSDGLLIP